VDRGNEKVSYLYDPLHPSVLKLIKYVIDSAHNNKIWVGVCGEMAAKPILAFILIGLGADELSMSSLAIPDVKRMIRNIRLDDSKMLAEKILTFSDPLRIRKEAERTLLKLIPDMKLV
jgi:phosphotransferase system enzyme I (PtsI)